jgi:gliding motility-associated-like protein
VSFYTSQDDADNAVNAVSSPFRNTDAFLQTIFVRIENNGDPNCADTSLSFDLIVNEKPEALDFDAFQCDEDGVFDDRTVFNLPSFDASVANSANGVTVSYFLNQVDADSDLNQLPDNFTNTSAPQSIVAKVTNDANGCTSTSRVTLDVSGSDAQDTTLEQCDNDGDADGFVEFDLSIADGDVLINAPANVTVIYYLTLNDALTEENALNTFYTNSIAGSEIIFARAESPDGNCFGISEVTLVVNPLPVLEPNGFEEYCGNDPQPLTLEAGITVGSPQDYTYLWSTGEMTPTIDVAVGGTYTVEVLEATGCSATREIDVVISETATIDDIVVINAGGNPTGSAEIIASGRGDYEFSLDPFFGYQDDNNFNNLAAGFYTAFVNDKNGCGETTQDFIVVGYPRFFTPNGDGFNDRWQLIGVSNVFEQNSEIFIFDRYGRLLKQISPEGAGWDGTFNNIPLPSSDYWFRATLMDGSEFTGHFTLKR